VVLHVPPVLNVGDYTVSVWLGTGSDELLYEPGAGAFTLFGDDRLRPNRAVVLDLPFDVVSHVPGR
jgi:ABC-2 type transport system ATP-binding protein/lipopolysaccharide transport system ATP-binding protein